ncbi:ketosynthase chain-length factor [Streptomyces sp. H27-D2]|uniref:ketosynthase chain-length factor n=1 Tax=Streptomyces sp. H27-D2 TaxID=3046304 RepID=UPI002DB74A0E|nr:ketosynthase chain-length factor [Streptomyces sp. H27-D2]MEC4017638.1 ketosynthase chain-length factor [Streptomyces sp. H27-D2]
MSPTTVVTGLGVTAPNGLGTEDFWKATLAGESGLARVTRFDPEQYPSTVAGEVPGYTAEDHIPSRLMPQTDHMTRLALTAADWAIKDAGVEPGQLPEYGMGVVTSASGGAVEFGQHELQNLWSKGKEYVSAYQSFAWFYAVNTGQISIRHKMRGPSGVLLTEQAGGIDAVGHARRHIRKGVPLVVSGGVDAALCPWGWVPQIASGLMSTESDPDRAFLPFGTGASGYVPGEGGAILVVEDADSARQRGATQIYGEVAGYAATLDPPPRLVAGPPAAGSGPPDRLGRAAENAIADAGLTPADIDVVFADASGVPELDRAEARVLADLFGPHGVPVTAPKTMTGRLLAGGAALDVATALLSLRDGVIPPTVNVPEAAPEYRIDLVTGAPREAALRTALVLARGHGGFNAALVLRRAA